MKKLLCLVVASALLCGCVSTAKFAPSPADVNWNNVRILGAVSADSGQWPLSDYAHLSEYTYYNALKNKASEEFHVPINEIVLGEVSVHYLAEMDGTVRNWKAVAIAGQQTNNPAFLPAPDAP